MNVPVTLAGFPAAWRFRGSAELDAWLADQPWRQQGGVLVIRIASADLADELARAVRRAVRGSDDADTDVQVPIVEPALVSAGLSTALERVLELPIGMERRTFIEAAARAFSLWAQGLILPAGAPRGNPPLLTAAPAPVEQGRPVGPSGP